jgi:hypothetical protein
MAVRNRIRWQFEKLTTQAQNFAHLGDLVKHRPTAKPKILIQIARAPKKYTIPAATLPMLSPPAVSETTLKFLAKRAPKMNRRMPGIYRFKTVISK